MPSVSSRTRWIVVALALVAALALATAATSPDLGRWWAIGERVGVGPTGTVACLGDDCGRQSLDWVGGGDGWRQAASATVAASLIAALALIALAATQAARRPGRLAAGVVVTSTITAAAAAIAFVAMFPGTDAGGAFAGQRASLDRGVAIHAVGLVLAVVAAVVVLRGRAVKPA